MSKLVQKLKCLLGRHQFHMWGELSEDTTQARITITCNFCDLKLGGELYFLPTSEYMKKKRKWKFLELIKG